MLIAREVFVNVVSDGQDAGPTSKWVLQYKSWNNGGLWINSSLWIN